MYKEANIILVVLSSHTLLNTCSQPLIYTVSLSKISLCLAYVG